MNESEIKESNDLYDKLIKHDDNINTLFQYLKLSNFYGPEKNDKEGMKRFECIKPQYEWITKEDHQKFCFQSNF